MERSQTPGLPELEDDQLGIVSKFDQHAKLENEYFAKLAKVTRAKEQLVVDLNVCKAELASMKYELERVQADLPTIYLKGVNQLLVRATNRTPPDSAIFLYDGLLTS
ncbi:hypothetical protein ACH5RR_033747 [Cinchona calisaya]|uniref:Uncharacterized protein n=1 Tax=Cinchona calisaya TaxID=153742 RepID=A0ABD2YB43_9GENT